MRRQVDVEPVEAEESVEPVEVRIFEVVHSECSLTVFSFSAKARIARLQQV